MLWYRDTGTGRASGKEFSRADEFIPVGDTADGATVTGKDFRDHFRISRTPLYNAAFRSRQLIMTGAKDVCMLIPLSSLQGYRYGIFWS